MQKAKKILAMISDAKAPIIIVYIIIKIIFITISKLKT
jgi:hypothetical protein